MEWEEDALKVMEKVPRFVRGRVKKKVEDHARKDGQTVITKEFVLTLKKRKITTGDFEEIEKMLEGLDARKSRFYHVRMCGGAVGCPLTLIEDRQVAEKVVDVIESTRLPEFLEERIKGPVLSHNRFKVAIAGCPNCCSEPQIKDFGVIAEARPGVSEERCINCLKCVKVCRERAVTVENGIPLIDSDLCVNCGECVTVCPTGTLIIEKSGFKVVVGGKLGRHPQFAQTLFSLEEEASVYHALKTCIDVFRREYEEGERLGSVLNRIGVNVIKKEVENG